MDWDRVEVHKHAKKERGQYPAILTKQAWSIKDLLYGFRRNVSCGIQQVVPSGQDSSILLARVANHWLAPWENQILLSNEYQARWNLLDRVTANILWSKFWNIMERKHLNQAYNRNNQRFLFSYQINFARWKKQMTNYNVNWKAAAVAYWRMSTSHHALEIFKVCCSCSQTLFRVQNKASHKT